MTIDRRAETETIRRELAAAHELTVASIEAQNRASISLQRVIETDLQQGIERLSPCDVPVTGHRRAHRPGRPPAIDTDPELRAFIRARIDRLTFVQIAQEIAAHFPPKRRVGKTTIHKWWQKQNTRRNASGIHSR